MRSALSIEELPQGEPDFVESGLEQIDDGLHVRTPLAKGHQFTLAVACAGRGSLRLTVAAKDGGGSRVLRCDGVPVRQRLTSAGTVRLDTSAEGDASGAVGWRIDRYPSTA
ncbi:hypothetical protein HUT18_15305 [Streptomyces sp. NA04227]|uniref:hypothetical protein n=1 Tax=Streptomyces sp. NA04227 TaxID=2742136 RepID=UPI001591B1BA|nr:hypothetical protein [Streptomyces sp. NA04227]QKW07546.1 hypothetical protein HUT18_15305 [Streptomyces sp. NA04227]